MVQIETTHSFFFHKLIFSIPDVDNSELIIAGDRDCALNPQLERSSQTANYTEQELLTLSYSLMVSWRYLNPVT